MAFGSLIVSYEYRMKRRRVDNKMGMENFLPDRIKSYLNARGITDAVIEHNKITWDGERIVIPIFNVDGIWMFNKYRRDPAADFGPKYSYDKGAVSALYGAEKLSLSDKVIICEGEFDSLILEAHGFVGVTSTGGAGTFRESWFDLMAGKELFMCFDKDEAGSKGMEKLARMRPEMKMIPLPVEVGEHGDITDFFVKLGKSRKDFEILMKVAEPLKVEPDPKSKPVRRKGNAGVSNDRLKTAKEVPLDRILKFNRQDFAKCPYHSENTASLHWIKDKNKFHCFGCSAKGDSIDLVMKLQNISIKDAIDYLLTL